MSFGGVSPHNYNDISISNRRKILSSSRLAKRLLQTVSGWGMTDARAGINVVIAKARSHHLLDEPDLFIGAARRRNRADTFLTVLFLDATKSGGRKRQRFIPTHFLPRLINRVSDHGLGHAVFMRSVTKGKTSFDASVPLVRFTVLPWGHANDFLPTHLCLEAAANTAISAGRSHRMLGNTTLDDTVLGEGRRWASCDTGAA